jgi:signal transduction histidine kinase
MADSDPANSFFFTDHLVLDESPTREFYKSIFQGLIHKNNNVLGVIQGFSSLILMDDDLGRSLRENVEQMKNSSIEASELAKVILTTAGCARISLDAVDLAEFLPNIERKAREAGEKNGVSVKFNASPNLPAVTADSNRLNELLSELVLNAAEAAADIPGGEVAIDVLPPGEASAADLNQVDFFIRNSSEEIPAEDLRGLFKPFNSTKGNSHYGLGLTTAGVLAGQMRMRLGIRCIDGTTTVWLSLPVAG